MGWDERGTGIFPVFSSKQSPFHLHLFSISKWHKLKPWCDITRVFKWVPTLVFSSPAAGNFLIHEPSSSAKISLRRGKRGRRKILPLCVVRAVLEINSKFRKKNVLCFFSFSPYSKADRQLNQVTLEVPSNLVFYDSMTHVTSVLENMNWLMKT